MAVNLATLKLIKEYEGLRLKAYPDPASGGDPWTIGYGHTKNVNRGDAITEAQAEQFLADDLKVSEAAVDTMIGAPLNANQRGALVSFVFNLGAGNFAKSTLLDMVQRRDWDGAAEQFGRWVHGAGRVMPGLVRRRSAERALFMTPVAAQNDAPISAPTPDVLPDAPMSVTPRDNTVGFPWWGWFILVLAIIGVIWWAVNTVTIPA